MRNSSTPTPPAAERQADTCRGAAISGRTDLHPRAAAARVRRARAVALLAATGAALAVWVLTRLLGIGLTVRLAASGPALPVDPSVVVIVSVLAGVAGWVVLAGLEQLTARARWAWLGLAIVALVLSLAGPLGAGTTTGARVSLAAMHVLAAAILIPTYVRTSGR